MLEKVCGANWSSLIQYWRSVNCKTSWNHSFCTKESMNHQSFIKTEICTNMARKCSQNVHGSIILIVQIKQLRMPSQIEWKKEIWVYSYNRILYCSTYIAVYTHAAWANFTTTTERKANVYKKKLNDSTYIKFRIREVNLWSGQLPQMTMGSRIGAGTQRDTVVLVLTNFIIWMVGYVGGSLCDSLLSFTLFFFRVNKFLNEIIKCSLTLFSENSHTKSI